MSSKSKIIIALNELGRFLSQFSKESVSKDDSVLHNELFFNGFLHQLKISEEYNGWFSKDNLLFAVENWSALLNTDSLYKWTSNYNFENSPKNEIKIYPGSIIFVPRVLDDSTPKRLAAQAYISILGNLGIALASLASLND